MKFASLVLLALVGTAAAQRPGAVAPAPAPATQAPAPSTGGTRPGTEPAPAPSTQAPAPSQGAYKCDEATNCLPASFRKCNDDNECRCMPNYIPDGTGQACKVPPSTLPNLVTTNPANFAPPTPKPTVLIKAPTPAPATGSPTYTAPTPRPTTPYESKCLKPACDSPDNAAGYGGVACKVWADNFKRGAVVSCPAGIRAQCPHHCQACVDCPLTTPAPAGPAPATPAPATPAPCIATCVDKSPVCNLWRAWGETETKAECSVTGSSMGALCARTCGTCTALPCQPALPAFGNGAATAAAGR